MTKSSESIYCPLCGAHEYEWNEAKATREVIISLEQDIKLLHAELLKLTGERS